MRRKCEYRLRKVAGRASHFAQVTLFIFTAEDSLPTDGTREGGGAPALWVDAAREGALQALRELRLPSMRPVQVHIESCEGTPADTDVDTLWCAAFLAAASVVAPGKEVVPSFGTEARRWHVLLEGRTLSPPPALIARAAHRRV